MKTTLEQVLVSELKLGEAAEDVAGDTPLLGEPGLGLDSLDALYLGLCVEERFGVVVPEGEPAREWFESLDRLVDHILEAHAG